MKLKNVLIALSFVAILPLQCSASVYTPSKDRVRDFVIETAMSDGVDANLALAIVDSESGFNANVRNASSTASGSFQFINGTFLQYCVNTYHYADSLAEKNDYHAQILCGVRMLKDGLESQWDASSVKWKSLFADG